MNFILIIKLQNISVRMIVVTIIVMITSGHQDFMSFCLIPVCIYVLLASSTTDVFIPWQLIHQPTIHPLSTHYPPTIHPCLSHASPSPLLLSLASSIIILINRKSLSSNCYSRGILSTSSLVDDNLELRNFKNIV